MCHLEYERPVTLSNVWVEKETHLLYPTKVVSFTWVTLEYVESLFARAVAVSVGFVYPLTLSIRKDVLVGT